MANTIKLRRSATSGAIPTTSQLALGELAMNTFDGKLFLKTNQSGTEAIVEVGSGSSVTISSTTPSSPEIGDIYWDSDESSAYIYYDDGNTQQWVPLVATAPVSFDASAIVSGTLPVARGGTGTTSFDAGKIAEGNTEAEVVDTGTDGHFKVTTEGTERLRINNAGTAIFTGEVQDLKGGIRVIPQNSQTSAYTLVAGDVGKHVSITTGGVTIPSGVFSAGDAITIYNNSGSDQTITQGGSVTLRLAGDGTSGNKTLATYGLCTVLCVASNEFVIAGTGLS